MKEKGKQKENNNYFLVKKGTPNETQRYVSQNIERRRSYTEKYHGSCSRGNKKRLERDNHHDSFNNKTLRMNEILVCIPSCLLYFFARERELEFVITIAIVINL
jgi:hypothetical protein